MRRTMVHATLAGGLLILVGLAALTMAADPAGPVEPPAPPLGLPPVPWPEDNPYSPAKVELGRFLYFDKRLSSDGTIACASCHETGKAFTDSQEVSTGISGQKGGRSAPTVINRAYSMAQFWDGRASTLEEQVKGPLANPIEMTIDREEGQAHRETVKRIRAIPGYVALFRKAFGTDEITIDHVARAVATFERTVLSGNAPFDRYQAGDAKAMTEAQVRGMDVFYNKAACDACHIGFNFTDSSYANIGIGMDKPKPDLGRYVVSGREEDKGAFKTPTLREIEHTGPYMHDGSIKTLEDVVEHYNKGGIKNPYIHQRMKPLNLSDGQKADLVAFLKALSGEGWQAIKAPATFPK